MAGLAWPRRRRPLGNRDQVERMPAVVTDLGRCALRIRLDSGADRPGRSASSVSQLNQWLERRAQLPIGPVPVVDGSTRGRAQGAITAARAELHRLAVEAGVRRRFSAAPASPRPCGRAGTINAGALDEILVGAGPSGALNRTQAPLMGSTSSPERLSGWRQSWASRSKLPSTAGGRRSRTRFGSLFPDGAGSAVAINSRTRRPR
jgi:hypothetical protein